jgi:N-acetylgalactosamine-6-sulfatase
MKYQSILFCLCLVALQLATLADEPNPSTRPNVIFILTDDQGWNDAHFAGHPYVKTPNLDKLAAEGTWLRQFYVASTVCSPSRCGFLTSQYPARHLIHGHFASHELNEKRHMVDWLNPDTPTIASLLKKSGYATAHVGKWHLGGGQGAPTPEAYGFDFVRHTTGNKSYWEENGEDPYFRAKSTSLFVDETIQFIRENKDRPFYVNLWTLLPHAKLNPTPEQLKEYESISPQADHPAFGPWMKKYLANTKDLKSQSQVFYASLTDLDTQLGRLFAALEEMKLADNTIIFFSSDNGAEDYRVGNATNAGVGNTGPLRARKRSMYEGGIRTFGIVRWPGHVPAGRRDETSVTGGVDLLPTICKLAGVTLPKDLKPDGEDVSDIWLGQSRPRQRPLHWEWLFNVQGRNDGYMPPMLAVRDGDWKLFVNHDGSGAQLYNIPNDIGEENDIAQQHPDIVQALTAKALAWAKSLPPSPARDAATKTGKPQDGQPTTPSKPAKSKPSPSNGQGTNLNKPDNDRAKIFASRDKNQDGLLTLEEFSVGFAKDVDFTQRFKLFDTDHDDRLTKDEFIKMGKR